MPHPLETNELKKLSQEDSSCYNSTVVGDVAIRISAPDTAFYADQQGWLERYYSRGHTGPWYSM